LKFLIVIFSLFFALAAPASSQQEINSKLSCKVFIDAMPEADLEIHITGQSPIQESRMINGKTGRFRTELSWEGYFEGYPKNPELRIQYMDRDDNVIIEAYKNFDLHKFEKENKFIAENDDNLGMRTAKEVVYLSCEYNKVKVQD
jgi:hypothetical protein